MPKLLLSALLLASAAFGQANPDWHREFPPFRIAGNLYYVGTADLAIYLIQTPQGNILINTNFDQDVPLLKQSISKLGMKYEDTKILLISHAHSDHDGATATVVKETGAKLMVMEPDVKEEERRVKVDRVLHDGDVVELGGYKWTARLTPGHTPGCTTWVSQIDDGGRKRNVVIVGSPNVNVGYYLVGNRNYPKIADDYVVTFNVLKSLPADVFLGAHGAYFGLKEKYAKYAAGDQNAFIDPVGYKAYVAEREQSFRDEWARQKQHPGTPKQ